MSDYTKATNFTAKDTLPTGNAGKIIKGAEIDTEFTAVASAVSSKANINSPTFTGTPASPTATAGSNTTQLANTAYVKAEITALSLGNMSTQAKTAVDITGGTIVGITDLAVADGGTGSSTFTANSLVLGNGTSALNANMVAPSTSGNVLTSNGTTWTSATNQFIGVGQTWQDMSASRTSGTTYTNSTGKPIMVNIGENTNSGATLIVGGVQVAQSSITGGDATMSAIVPNGATYVATYGGLVFWAELR